MAAFFIGASRSSLLESLESRTTTLGRPLAVALADPVVTRDRQRTQQLVNEERTADRDVAYAIAVDANGIVLAATDTSLLGRRSSRMTSSARRSTFPRSPAVSYLAEPICSRQRRRSPTRCWARLASSASASPPPP